MDAKEIAAWRLDTLGLTAPRLTDAAEVVRWLGAVQSQEFSPAKWSIAMRTARLRDDDVQLAYDTGAILRTHVLRATWHFVAAEDIRWLLAATGPRVEAGNASRYRRLGLDPALLARTTAIIAESLADRRHRTRPELAEVLAGEGIDTNGQRLAHMVMHAELTAVICSGTMRGRAHTYALLDERAATDSRTTDEAVRELVTRYVTSHGPTTLKDLQAWSSITAEAARSAIAAVGDRLQHMEVEGQTYWYAGDPPGRRRRDDVQLLQMYDEYVMGYRETRGVLDVAGVAGPVPMTAPSFHGVVVADTQVVGRWRRRREADVVEVDLVTPLDHANVRSLHAEVDRYAAFLGVKLRAVTI